MVESFSIKSFNIKLSDHILYEFLHNCCNGVTYTVQSFTSSDSNFELDSRQAPQVYLVTFSQANRTKFPTRYSFAEAVVTLFTQ